MTDRPKTGKRIQVYLAARHTEWWEDLPRYERSRIVAEALDLYRKHQDLHVFAPDRPDNSADNSAPPSDPAS